MKADMQFKRIDSDAIPHLIEREDSAETVLSETERKTVEGLFSALPNNKAAKTVVKALAPDAAPVVIVKPEFMRRMSDMQYMMQGPGTDGEDNPFLNHYECVINGNHPVIAQKLLATGEGEMQNALADYLFQLAMLDQQMLRGEALHAFVKSSLQRLNG
jgi:molecular chaperone HtpG